MSDLLANDYGLSTPQTVARIAAPELPYRPPSPKAYNPAIGVIGCGGISGQHLNAYRQAGYRVTALCDRNEHKAVARRDEFYPQAKVCTDYRDLLAIKEIEVVDVTTHPADRVEIMEAALLAGKHVLSQKPFVTDLAVGLRLIGLADSRNLKLAVNQNARWAPHFSYIRQAIAAGLIGKAESVNFTLHWDHSWVIGTEYEKVEHLLLYDFGIHWFDLIFYFFPAPRFPQSVYATTSRAAGQMLAQAMIEFLDGQASIIFNANVKYGQQDSSFVAGTKGCITSTGPSLSEQTVTLFTEQGVAVPQLEGTWFREGFHGAMAELLCAIEENREPINRARSNLRSLGLCFDAIASAISKTPMFGQTQQLPKTPDEWKWFAPGLSRPVSDDFHD